MPESENVGAIGDRIRALLAKIAELREIAAKLWELFPDLSLADLFEIVQAGKKLLPLPDLADEAGCRAWCRSACGVLAQVADLTTTTLDDSAVAVVVNVVEDDTLWGLAWDVIGWVTREEAEGGPTRLKPMSAAFLGEKVGIDPFTIIAIIQAVVSFIQWWKNRRNG